MYEFITIIAAMAICCLLSICLFIIAKLVYDKIMQRTTTKIVVNTIMVLAAFINAAFQLLLLVFVPFLYPKISTAYYVIFICSILPIILYTCISLSNRLTDSIIKFDKTNSLKEKLT